MNCVGIDVSKGKSMIAVMRPFGEVVVSPFEVRHTANELSELAGLLKSLDGETRVVMESTGNYHAPVAWLLHDAGLYVSVVNAMLVHDYGNNSLRRAKTDKKDAVKLANYGLDHWLTLPRYIPEEDTRLMLKICYRQYQQYSKVQTMLKNNLISLLDTTFPDANRLFTSPPRADGSEKWVDFVATFGIASAFVAGLRRPLLPNTRSGAESTATISARIRRWIFMPLLADTSVSYRKRIRQNFW
ncbi:MAG: IS110 family transposase [Neglectibacter timonensis]|uniref:IS110 family transposase n=1 Tax=Neglectibacter timonensis TaxID=1776382 RepID=UPI0039931C66